MENLLSNAAEFSPPKGTIEVGIERVRRSFESPVGFETVSDGPLCLLSVSDEGPGVPLSERARIFDQFYTAGREDSKLKKGGTGLGLTIAKRIVDDHEGELWVEDNPSGHGSRFCVLLQSSAPSQEPIEAVSSQSLG